MLVFPIVDSTYLLDCDGPGGAMARDSVTITVGFAVSAALVADVNPIAPGGSSNLTWTGAGGATGCSGEGFSTSGDLTGTVAVF